MKSSIRIYFNYLSISKQTKKATLKGSLFYIYKNNCKIIQLIQLSVLQLQELQQQQEQLQQSSSNDEYE